MTINNIRTDDKVETGAVKFSKNGAPGLYIDQKDAFKLEFILAKILRQEKLFKDEYIVLEKYYFLINRQVCSRG